MFGFVTRHARDFPDPLQTRRVAAQWFETLPALDVIGRQEHVLHAFAALQKDAPAFDLDRVAAILYLETALGADHHRLLKWYFENLRGSARLADRFWEAASGVTAGFIHAYGAALAAALAHPDDRRWKALRPRLTARLIHFHGIDAELHLYRGESWDAAHWAQVHSLFLRAAEAAIERAPTALPGEDPLATRYSVEQEYIHVLLLQRLHTGNMTPGELEWAGAQLRMWVRDLALDAAPRTEEGFFVDLAGGAGLARRSGNDQGAKVGYLDTTPLVAKLDRALAELRQIDADADVDADARTRERAEQQGAILDKLRPAIAPSRSLDLRRHPRVAVDVTAEVRVGLARIAQDLAQPDPTDVRAAGAAPGAADARSADPSPGSGRRPARTPFVGADLSFDEPDAAAAIARLAAAARNRVLLEALDVSADNVEQIEIRPLADGALPGARVPERPVAAVDVAAAPAATQTAAAAPHAAAVSPLESPWRIKDRSVAGWRISAPGGVGQGLALGALVAVWPADMQNWALGMVSRVARNANGEIEAGMSLLASRVVPVTLHSLRRGQSDVSYGGIEVSRLGERFEGLYLMPPERVDTRIAARTLIIPSSEHVVARAMLLTTPRSDYEVTLGPAIEQRADWSWVTMQVSRRTPRVRP